MGRRIEVELTSTREDGSWTWRAAGARQPKGELGGSLLYEGAKVGDVVKVEAEFHVDGIEVTEVFAPKQKKERTNLLQMKSRQFRDDELVTTQRVSRDERRGGRRNNRRGERDDRRRGRGDRGDRGPRPEAESRPKPKRLRPRRTHRDALLAEVGDEYRPIIEQVMKDGMPGVRAAIDRQNAEAKEAGKPAIEAAPILAIAEKNLNKARLAEWRDRADAALADAAELDIRDLRSVVVSGNDVARDDESRAIADQLKTALDERVESDHATWLADMESAINDGRVVRALRLSSRPVKAGAPLPPELATTLAGQASEALASDVGQERWATVLDALAYSPVRGAVTPTGLPAEPKNDLLDAVKRLSDRIPAIAELFGIDPASVPRSAKRRRPRRDGGAKKGRGGQGQSDGSKQGGGGQGGARNEQPASTDRPDAPAADAPAAEAAPASPPAEAAAEAAAPEAAPAEAPETAAEAPVAEAAPATEPPVQERAPAEESAPEPAPAESTTAAPTPEAAPEQAPAEDAAAEAEAAPAEAEDTPAPAEAITEDATPEPAPAEAVAEEPPAEDVAAPAEAAEEQVSS